MNWICKEWADNLLKDKSSEPRARPPQVDFVPGIQIWIQNVPAKTREKRGFYEVFLTLSIIIYSDNIATSYNFNTCRLNRW